MADYFVQVLLMCHHCQAETPLIFAYDVAMVEDGARRAYFVHACFTNKHALWQASKVLQALLSK